MKKTGILLGFAGFHLKTIGEGAEIPETNRGTFI
jgi:hypothetical protein